MKNVRMGIPLVTLAAVAGAWGATLLGSYPSPGPRADGLGYVPTPPDRLAVTTWDVKTGSKVCFILIPTTGSVASSFPLSSFGDVYGSDYGYVSRVGYIFVCSGAFVTRYRRLNGQRDGRISTAFANTRGVGFKPYRLVLTEAVPNGRLWEVDGITGNRFGEYKFLGFLPGDLGYDAGYYWIADPGSSCIRKVTTNGSTVGSFATGFVPRGVAADDDTVYVGRRSPDYIYRYDVAGTGLTAVSFGKVKTLFR